MPTNVLRNNQSYPELGYRIDGNGIAFDLKTNQPLSREEVDQRIAVAEAKDPTSNDYAERERKRGGVAGFYDRNKNAVIPAADILATMLGVPPGLVSGLAKGFDQEGKGGVNFDALDAAKGYGQGLVMDKVAGGVGNGLLNGLSEGSVGSGIKTGVASIAGTGATKGGVDGAVSTLAGGAKNLMGGGGGGAGSDMSKADWLKVGAAALGAGLNYSSAKDRLNQEKAQFERGESRADLGTAVNAQQAIDRAPMADKATALLMSRMAPTAFQPRDWTRGSDMEATMRGAPTGGPADRLATSASQAAAYQPGQGGVNTDILEMLKQRMLKNAGMRA